jgi:hypothetical protein
VTGGKHAVAECKSDFHKIKTFFKQKIKLRLESIFIKGEKQEREGHLKKLTRNNHNFTFFLVLPSGAALWGVVNSYPCVP